MLSAIVTDTNKVISTVGGKHLRIQYKPDDFTRFPRSEFSRPKPRDYLEQLAGTSFTEVTTNIDFGENDFEHIPRNIERLHLESNEGEHLTEAKLSSNSRVNGVTSQIKIASHLKHLIVRKPYSKDWIKALPQTLETLAMTKAWHFDESYYKIIPPNLKKLCISDVQTDTIYPSSNIDLPAKLETLYLNSQTRITNEFFSKIPRTLKFLVLDNAVYNHVTPEGLSVLPQDLIGLDMSFDKAFFKRDKPWNLPKNLSTLFIRSDRTDHWESLNTANELVLQQAICSLPENLRNLILSPNVSIDVKTLLQYQLPPNLEFLDMSIYYSKQKADSKEKIQDSYITLADSLPANLETLKLQISPEDMFVKDMLTEHIIRKRDIKLVIKSKLL
jgi:hypothetical protein